MTPRRPTPENPLPREVLRHHLRDHFKAYSDDHLIEELDAFPSSRAWAEATLQPTASALRADHALDLHLVLHDYLRTHRPGILARADRLAEDLASQWPRNHRKLDFFARQSAWRNMVRARFTRLLRKRFQDPDAEGWVDLIWPLATRMIESDPALRSESPTVAATTLLLRFCVPTNPKHQGVSIYKAILRTLRARLKAFRAVP